MNANGRKRHRAFSSLPLKTEGRLRLENGKGRVVCFAAVCLLAACLCSCEMLQKLGFDVYDYMGETVIATYGADSEMASSLLPMLEILITDSTTLPAFDHMRDAIGLYRDAVLRHMLEKDYAKYSGNRALIEEAEKEYPAYQITQIIPAVEFEATMYEYFGGSVKITHKDGAIFKYLKKVNAYICNLTPTESGIRPEISRVDETEKTYRVTFRCVSGEETSGDYFALIIKREDGTYYFKRLSPL